MLKVLSMIKRFKKGTVMKILILLTALMITLPAHSEKNYIKGVQKVTFRSGPGTDSKILKMMDADSPVIVLEAEGEWSKVKDLEGREGYILARFLSKDVPSRLLYNWMKEKYGKLDNKHRALIKDKKELTKNLIEANSQLINSSKKISESEKSYNELKQGSTEYLKLQSNYKSAIASLDEQNIRVMNLETQLSRRYIFWFLAGGGVLFLGWLIGLQSRKRKHNGQLSF